MATDEGAPPPGGTAPAAAPDEKKLTNAELKKKQKEEKAAKRAQAKAVLQSSAPQPAATTPADTKGKPKPKQDGQQSKQGPKGGTTAAPTTTTEPAAPKDPRSEIPECFSHLSMARRIPITEADKDVHPAVLDLGQRMSTFAICDSITRLETTLLAFKQVIESYSTPHATTFSRHFTSHVLNPQIEYLTACRPMCFSMGNAIRWLKLQISKVDIDLPDQDAKELICDAIDNFIRERINLADVVIIKTAAARITDGSVVLTYAHHHLVERSLLHAKAEGKNFRVIVVDDAWERVGHGHAKRLSQAGIPMAYYTDFGALRIHLQKADVVMVAAEAMFGNGAMYAVAGTADVALMAKDTETPVVALCETINFTERAPLDSLTYNEIDPERHTADLFRLLFDTTGQEFISTIITELGNHQSRSVSAILRKLEVL